MATTGGGVSDQRPEPGWYPDPTTRFEQRYWNGDEWTEWVLVAGSQQIDRFWDGPKVGGTAEAHTSSSGSSIAAGAAAPVASTARSVALRERLARPRPPVSVQSAVAAAAGAAVVLGILALAGDAPDRTAVALLGVVVLAVSYGFGLVGPERSRAAGLPGAVVGPAMVIVAALGEVFSGTAQVVFPVLCLAVVWLVMFAAPGFTGAPILLVGSMLAAWSALVVAIWGGAADRQYQFGSSDPYVDGGVYVDTGPVPFDLQGVTSTTAVVTLLAALACVVAAGVADRRGWHVLGTPFVATGVILSSFGLYVAAIAFMGDAETVSFLTIAVGVSLLVVGALGDRRGSVWLGAATGLVGLIALLVQNIDSSTGGGLAMLVVGAVLFAAAPMFERALRRPEPAEAT
jgi:hypothetical protein